MRHVYVSCHHAAEANRVAELVRRAGHAVASTWHASTGLRPDQGDGAAWGVKAAQNLFEVRNADTLVLVASPRHIDGTHRVPGGKFMEAGFALGHGLAVFTVGGVENGMLHHPSVRHAADEEELLAMLGN